MESDLAQTRVKLEEALERVKVIHQVVTIDLPYVAEVGFLCLSLTPWSFAGCLSMLASRFVGSRGGSGGVRSVEMFKAKSRKVIKGMDYPFIRVKNIYHMIVKKRGGIAPPWSPKRPGPKVFGLGCFCRSKR